MYVADIIRRSGRSLRTAKMRTILTSLAIAVGGFTLTATLAAGNGIRDYTDTLVQSNFDPTELVVGRDPEVANTGEPNSQPKEYDDTITSMSYGQGSSLQLKQVTSEDVTDLKKLPYAEEVREYYQLQPQYITREGQKRYTVSAEVYNHAQKPELAAGAVPSGVSIGPGQVVVPEVYVSLLGFTDAKDALGKQITISSRRAVASTQEVSGLAQPTFETQNSTYTIAAISKKAATSLAVGALPILLAPDDARAMYDFTTKDTAEYGKYMYVFMRVKDGTDPAKINVAQADLKAKNYYTLSTKEIQKSITQVVNVLQGLVGVFGLITLLASVFGIINTQYISVLERTREIGLMKALGMRNRDVRRLFMLEAAWIGFLGGLIGSVTAYIVGTLMNPWVTRKLELGAGNSLLQFNLGQIIALLSILIIIAMLAGFFPARKAAKLDPIEALRTE